MPVLKQPSVGTVTCVDTGGAWHNHLVLEASPQGMGLGSSIFSYPALPRVTGCGLEQTSGALLGIF